MIVDIHLSTASFGSYHHSDGILDISNQVNLV